MSIQIGQDNIRKATSNDPVLQMLMKIILEGWPNLKANIRPKVHPYFNIRDELTVDSGLIYKGTRIVIPRALRQSMLTKDHGGHVGMEGCIHHLKEALFWPGMIADAKAFIGNCETCLSVQDLPQKEPLLSHSFAMHPWAKVAADICKLDGRFLLVVVDYFSNFIEVGRLHTISSNAVMHALSEIWAR